MSSCYITLHLFFYFILSLLLLWSPFYSILFYSTLFQIDSILFYFILLNSIYCIVQYSISYQWMICVYLSVCPSVCLFICMNKFLFSFLFSFSLFSWTSSSHTHIHIHGHGHTNTYEYMFLHMTRTYYFKRR